VNSINIARWGGDQTSPLNRRNLLMSSSDHQGVAASGFALLAMTLVFLQFAAAFCRYSFNCCGEQK
jgi:hypothetical protein